MSTQVRERRVDPFAGVFGGERGRPASATVLALTPGDGARDDYERLRPMDSRSLPEVLRLLGEHPDWPNRPLLASLHDALSARLAQWAHPSNTPALKALLAACRLRDAMTRRVFRTRCTTNTRIPHDSLHVWLDGDRLHLDDDGARVTFACGLVAAVAPADRVRRGGWWAPGGLDREFSREHGHPLAHRCSDCAPHLDLSDTDAQESRTFPALPAARLLAHDQARRGHAREHLSALAGRCGQLTDIARLGPGVARDAFLDVASMWAQECSDRLSYELAGVAVTADSYWWRTALAGAVGEKWFIADYRGDEKTSLAVTGQLAGDVRGRAQQARPRPR